MDHSELVSRHIFGYDPEACTLCAPPPVSWAVLWFLMHYSGKHRSQSKKLPSLSWASQDTWNSLQKYLWRIESSKSGAGLPFIPRVQPQNVAQCIPQSASDYHSWVSHFRRIFLDLAQANIRKFVNSGNTFGLVRLAMQELHRLDLVIVPLDKSPGFVLVDPTQFSVMEELALPIKYYMPCPLSCVNVSSCINTYKKLASDIANFHGDMRVARNICSSLESGSFVLAISLTVKGHKPLYSQSLRTIHKGVNCAFLGLMNWLVAVLEPHHNAVEWSYKDSFAVYNELQGIVTTESSSFAKIDLKDFFLCGSAWDVADKIATYNGGDIELSRLIHRATFFLLDNQYIVTSTLQCTYKCISGSGIGLKISALVAGLYFHKVVESVVVPRAAGLQNWIRYHDDVLAHFSSRQAYKSCVADLRKVSAGIWIFKIEGIASVGKSLEYLDLSICVQVPRLQVCASQHKPITPLCATSAHAPSIHSSWPKAVAKRVLSLSGGDIGALSTLSNRYRSKATHIYTQNQFDRFVQDPSLLTMKKQTCSSLESNQVHFVPLVLRFHPLFQWVVKQTLARVPPPPEFNIELRVSWKNAMKSMAGVVQKASQSSCKRAYGREGRCFLFGKSTGQNLSINDLHEFQVRHVMNS